MKRSQGAKTVNLKVPPYLLFELIKKKPPDFSSGGSADCLKLLIQSRYSASLGHPRFALCRSTTYKLHEHLSPVNGTKVPPEPLPRRFAASGFQPPFPGPLKPSNQHPESAFPDTFSFQGEQERFSRLWTARWRLTP